MNTSPSPATASSINSVQDLAGAVQDRGFTVVTKFIQANPTNLPQVVDTIVETLLADSVNDFVRGELIKGLDELRLSEDNTFQTAFAAAVQKVVREEPNRVARLLDSALHHNRQSLAVQIFLEAPKDNQQVIVDTMTRIDKLAQALSNPKIANDDNTFIELVPLLMGKIPYGETKEFVQRVGHVLDRLSRTDPERFNSLVSKILQSGMSGVDFLDVVLQMSVNVSYDTKRILHRVIVEHLTPKKEWSEDLKNFLLRVISREKDDQPQFVGYFRALAERSPDIAVTCLQTLGSQLAATHIPAILRSLAELGEQAHVIEALRELKPKAIAHLQASKSSLNPYKLLEDIERELRQYFGKDSAVEILCDCFTEYSRSRSGWSKKSIWR